MKYKREWDKLIIMGQKEGLTPEQVYFLIALRELEGGADNNEFNIKAVQNTSYDKQAMCAIDSIKKNDKRWQRHILEQAYIDYPSFFIYHGGPYGSGWHTDKLSVNKLRETIKEVRDEFANNSTVGEEPGLQQD